MKNMTKQKRLRRDEILANPHPQQTLSRRMRRQMARDAQKAIKGCHSAVQTTVTAVAEATASDAQVLPISVAGAFAELNLASLRKTAQERGIRVNGKRPSLCTKGELLEALK